MGLITTYIREWIEKLSVSLKGCEVFITDLTDIKELAAVTMLYVASTLAFFGCKNEKYNWLNRVFLIAFLLGSSVAIFMPLGLKSKFYVAVLILSAGIVRALARRKPSRANADR